MQVTFLFTADENLSTSQTSEVYFLTAHEKRGDKRIHKRGQERWWGFSVCLVF